MSAPSGIGPAGDGPVDRYLDELVIELAGHPPRELRALLAEAEAHLRDDVDAAVAAGSTPTQAELDAVARFGTAPTVAAADRHRGRTPVGTLVRQLAPGGVLLAAIGALAIGVSGVVAAVIRLVGGSGALVGVSPGQALAPADCTRWLALRPGARTCQAAAVADWADETVFYRLAAGVLGVALLVLYRYLRTSRVTSQAVTTVRDTVAVTAFGVAAVWSAGLGLDALVVGGGAGQWLSAAPVALVVAAVFAVRLVGDLRSTA